MMKTSARLVATPIKILTISLFFLVPAQSFSSPDCGNLVGCEKKFCEIESQLATAREQGNKRKADGLKSALEEATENCTDKGLEDDLTEEIAESKAAITEYEADLLKAEKSGKMDKVRKYQEKIDEEESKIKRLQSELSTLQHQTRL